MREELIAFLPIFRNKIDRDLIFAINNMKKNTKKRVEIATKMRKQNADQFN